MILKIPGKYVQIVDKGKVLKITDKYIISNRKRGDPKPEIHITIPPNLRNSKGLKITFNVIEVRGYGAIDALGIGPHVSWSIFSDQLFGNNLKPPGFDKKKGFRFYNVNVSRTYTIEHNPAFYEYIITLCDGGGDQEYIKISRDVILTSGQTNYNYLMLGAAALGSFALGYIIGKNDR